MECVEVDPQTDYVVKKLHSRKLFFEFLFYGMTQKFSALADATWEPLD